MKKIASIIVTALFILSLIVSVSAETNATYTIPKAKNAPVIDGVIGETEWAGAEKVAFSSFGPAATGSGGPTRDLGSKTAIYIMWDDSNVYFAAFMEDSTLSAANYCGGRAGWAVHWGDSVEVYTADNMDSGYTVFPYDEWSIGNTATPRIYNNKDFSLFAEKASGNNADRIATSVSLNEDNSVMYNYVMEWSMPLSLFTSETPVAGVSFPLAFGMTNSDIDTHVSNNPTLSFWNDKVIGDSGAVTNTAVLSDAVAGEPAAETFDVMPALIAVSFAAAAVVFAAAKKRHI